jgi:hypothetical protein
MTITDYNIDTNIDLIIDFSWGNREHQKIFFSFFFSFSFFSLSVFSFQISLQFRSTGLETRSIPNFICSRNLKEQRLQRNESSSANRTNYISIADNHCDENSAWVKSSRAFPRPHQTPSASQKLRLRDTIPIVLFHRLFPNLYSLFSDTFQSL